MSDTIDFSFYNLLISICLCVRTGPAWAGLTICPFGFRTSIIALALLNIAYAPFTLTLRPLERALTRVSCVTILFVRWNLRSRLTV